MFNRTTINTCFTSLVGWRSSASDCVAAISSGNQTSNSGIYVNDLAGLRLTTVYGCMSKDYTADSAGLNGYLDNLFTSSITELLQKYIILQRQKLTGTSLLANQQLGYKARNIRDYVAPINRFVGIEFRPWDTKSYVTEIIYLGVWLKMAQTLPIYIYLSDEFNPLAVIPLNYTAAGSIQKFSTIGLLDYATRAISQGNRYFIGYYESDLIAGNQAIDTRKECNTCGGTQIKKYAPYVRINPFSVPVGNTYSDKTVFDKTAVSHTDQSFGLTADINVTCDLANIFCENKDLFAKALQLKIGITAFWNIYNSKELGQEAELSKADARLMAEKYELDYEQELARIVIDFTNRGNCDCIGSQRGALQIMGF